MPSTCAVLWCSNDRRNTKGTGIRYFYIPREKKRQEQWIRACNRPDEINAKNAHMAITFKDIESDEDMYLFGR